MTLCISTVKQNDTIAKYKDKDNNQFFKVLGEKLSSTANSIVKLITSPVEAIETIGAEMGNTISRIAIGVKNIGRHRSDYIQKPADETLYGKTKRHLASDLNLDVYSSNPKVQEFLNETAKAKAAGKITVSIAMSLAPGLSIVSMADADTKINEHMRNLSSNEL
ncbi:hypothetical protein MCHI_001584 [Candidatus Magnetoovum chiemensis]|nr:hypothetical protein MCHI_001584 [Candidatus Magnetoovum chiemensis]